MKKLIILVVLMSIRALFISTTAVVAVTVAAEESYAQGPVIMTVAVKENAGQFIEKQEAMQVAQVKESKSGIALTDALLARDHEILATTSEKATVEWSVCGEKVIFAKSSTVIDTEMKKMIGGILATLSA